MRIPVIAIVVVAGCGDPTDAGPDAAITADARSSSTGAVRYPEDRTQSPITAEVAAHLVSIAAAGPAQDDHVFAKIGDSITVSSSFLHCFANGDVDLDGRDLAVDRFTPAAYERESQAAVVGWAARSAIAGSPTPLDEELAAIAPRYATLMFGTNDVGYRTIDQFGADVWTIVDTLVARGVIPVVSTFPPFDKDPVVDARVPSFNRIVRAIAQGRMVPLVDLHRELSMLADHGLGGDDIHPTTSQLGACVLTAAGLTAGYNVRNLVTIEQLDRARRAVGGEALDTDAPRRVGAGTAIDPFVANIAFADLADTRGGESTISSYPGCAATQNESGPETVYRVELAAPTHLSAHVVDRDDVDVDVHILAGSLDGASCVARGNTTAEADVGPGTVYIVVDSFVDAGTVVHAGEFLLAISTP